MRERFEKELEKCLVKGQLKPSEPMKLHTTFRIGGEADYFVIPADIEEIQAVTALCKKYGIPYYVIGNGSNLLVSDRGFRGVVLSVGKQLGELHLLELEDGRGRLSAQAGASLAKLAAQAAEWGLSGLEFAGGIPGTVGGAVRMNAGAYGSEMKDCLVSARILWEDEGIRTLSREELKLSYRSSILSEKPGIVLEAEFSLEEGRKEEISAKMNGFNQSRREKQPLNYPSAGSTFKRPEGYFAGKLIMDAGLKGFRIGDAMVSEKHCGFVINAGEATAAQVKELMEEVDRIVFEKFGVHLVPEVRLIGEW